MQNDSQKFAGGKNKEVGVGTKFKIGKLILSKKNKLVAARCHILRLKCTKFDFDWGSAPDPAVGAHSAPTDPLAGFNGSSSKGRGGRGKEMREGRGKKGSGEGGVRVLGGRPEISPPRSFLKVGAYALSAFLPPFPLHSLFAFPGSCF